jgi:TrmH family RNA methyltransferase
MPQPPPGWPTDRPRADNPTTALSSCAVVLCRTQGPVNLGMVARLCGNLGVTDLRLVAPECTVDCPEARMFSTHSRELLLTAPVYPDLAAAVADCGWVVGTSGDFRVGDLGSHLRPDQLPARLAERPCARWALVFGNEADGLDSRELAACQAWVHLDTFGPNISYNLANAVAITLYQVAVASAQAPAVAPVVAEEVQAPRAEVESLERYWLDTLERFGYFRRRAGDSRERFLPMFRRFLDRLRLSRHDLQVLRGMLAQQNVHVWGDRFDGKGPVGSAMPTRGACAGEVPGPPAGDG